MPSTDVGMRLPCYEGHLTFNYALLSDRPQTSDCTAWSERWCSLEDGKLLVYTDRTSAMINPEQTCLVIDVHSFACVHVANASPQQAYELVLSTALPEPSRSSRLFRPKSAMSLNRLQADAASRQNSVEIESRSSMASFSRASIQLRPVNANELSTLSDNSDVADHTSKAAKSWSKFGFGSRRLTSKLSSASNGSLRIKQGLPSAPSSTTSSILSNSDARPSTDIASSGVPSPRTPLSPTFSGPSENIPIRVPSSHTFTSWLDALALTIKMHNEMTAAPSPLHKQLSRMSARPALSNLPGFRTPSSLHTSPVFPSVENSVDPAAHDVTPKAPRKRHSSSASFSLAMRASRQMQDITSDRSGPHADPSDKAALSVAFVDRVSITEPRHRRPSTADASSSISSSLGGATDVRSAQQARAHKRSISTASSSFSFSGASRLSGQRRNSVPSAQLLSPSGGALSSTLALDTSFEEDSVPPRPFTAIAKSSKGGTSTRTQDAGKSTSSGPLPASKHRRSGSLLRFGSARILAWRDTFAAADATLGLGLQVDEGDTSNCNPADCSRDTQNQGKAAKTFSGSKSLRSLTKSKVNSKEANRGSIDRGDESVNFAPPWTPRCNEDVLTGHPAASQPSGSQSKSRSMSRSTSLLSITKQTFASLRERTSSSRPSVKTVFATRPCEEANTTDLSQDTSKRIEPIECDFSYELVGTTPEADALQGSVFGSAEEASKMPRVSVADDSREASTTIEERGVGTDDRVEDRFAELKLRPSLAGDGENTPSPFVPIERILPPKEIIDTFDKLRAADPTGCSCDWLCRIETTTGRRGSLDWAAATTATRRPSLRAAASQTFYSRGASMDLLAAPRLRSAMSAWDLPDRETIGSQVDGDVARRDERAGEDISDVAVATRSLPAPPRAFKRRARVSTCSRSAMPTNMAVDLVDSASAVMSEKASSTGRAFADLTNSNVNSGSSVVNASVGDFAKSTAGLTAEVARSTIGDGNGNGVEEESSWGGEGCCLRSV